MEILQDLIKPENTEIRIRECPDSGVFVTGLECVRVENTQDYLRIIKTADKNKLVGFTSINSASSRSHVLTIIKIEKRIK